MDASRFVVGYDGSDGARAALRWALEAAVGEGDLVEAVSIWTVPVTAVPPWLPSTTFDDTALAAAFEREMTESVEEDRGKVPGAPPVTTRLLTGVPGPTLVEAAAGARCLVVGRRGHGGFAGLLLGSVADHCLRHAATPVALVPTDEPEAPPTAAVVVGVDGSDHAADALRWAAAEAERRRRPLVAVYAWSWLDQPGPFDPGFDEAAAQRYAAGLVSTVVGGRPVTVVASNDLPTRALMARSAAGDLVVVGSRGLGAVRQALLGSVSRQLAHHAPSTVVVVRPSSTS